MPLTIAPVEHGLHRGRQRDQHDPELGLLVITGMRPADLGQVGGQEDPDDLLGESR